MTDRNGSDGEMERRPRPQNSGEILQEFLDGVEHIAVLCINPAHDSDTDEDRWTFVVPINGELKAVRSKYSGYVPKSDLRQFAMELVRNPERAEKLIAPMPRVEHPNDAKIITVWVPLLGV